MKEKQQSTRHVDRSEPPREEHKPFETPQLRREAGLTEATAERTFTFTTVS